MFPPKVIHHGAEHVEGVPMLPLGCPYLGDTGDCLAETGDKFVDVHPIGVEGEVLTASA
jgi:hypothetical protein